MSSLVQEASMSPIALDQGFGLLHWSNSEASTSIGVVLCSAWGIDELSSRKMLFKIASRLASAGIPTIRFDYPGTADAIGSPAESFDAWVEAASGAADRLKAACGVTRIVFAGLGLGGTVATIAASGRADIAGLALLAPVANGRRYLREIALGAPVVEEGLGLDASQRPAGVSIGGIVMPPAVASDLRSIDLMKLEARMPLPALVVGRPSQPQDAGVADHLESLGWLVDRAEFEGYDAAMDGPTISVLPEAVIDTVARWCRHLDPGTCGTATVAPPKDPVVVGSAELREEALTFDRGLFGVLTLPEGRSDAPTVVFLNSGYDYHAGWAYQWARTARTLAKAGVASLRFDIGNIGDSAPRAGAPAQVLYGEKQQADIAAAIDMLADRGVASVVAVGRCSGAFAALHATARDSRIAAAVLINPLRLIWDPDEDVEIAIRGGPRSMADYRQRALSGKTFKRLFKGEIDLRGVAKGLGRQAARRVIQRIAPLMGALSKTTRLRRQCHAMMGSISRRGTAIRFVCSEFDPSLEQMAFYFGRDYGALDRFAGVTLTTVPNADHNITPEPAHDMVAAVIRETALGIAAPSMRQNDPISGTAAAKRYPPIGNSGIRA